MNETGLSIDDKIDVDDDSDEDEDDDDDEGPPYLVSCIDYHSDDNECEDRRFLSFLLNPSNKTTLANYAFLLFIPPVFLYIL